MFPTHPAMLDAAAPEAAVKLKPVAADGDVTNAPKVHSLAKIAHECDAHSCSQVDLKPDGEQAKHSQCSTQPQAARTTLIPTSSVDDGSLSMRLQKGFNEGGWPPSFIIATLFILFYPINLVITTRPRTIEVRFLPPPLITVTMYSSLPLLSEGTTPLACQNSFIHTSRLDMCVGRRVFGFRVVGW